MRVSWQETWMAIADAVALRSDCVRAQCGAVIVDNDNRIVATGYNGPPAGFARKTDSNRKCSDYCDRPLAEEPSLCYADCVSVHAEANALLFCDRRDREGGRIYVTGSVCFTCAKLIANSGLRTVIMRDDSPHRLPEESVKLLRASGIAVIVWED